MTADVDGKALPRRVPGTSLIRPTDGETGQRACWFRAEPRPGDESQLGPVSAPEDGRDVQWRLTRLAEVGHVPPDLEVLSRLLRALHRWTP